MTNEQQPTLEDIESLLWDAHQDLGDWLQYAGAARRGEIKTPPVPAGMRTSNTVRVRLFEAALALQNRRLGRPVASWWPAESDPGYREATTRATAAPTPGLYCQTCKTWVDGMMDFTAAGDHAGHDIGVPEGHPLAPAPRECWVMFCDGEIWNTRKTAHPGYTRMVEAASDPDIRRAEEMVITAVRVMYGCRNDPEIGGAFDEAGLKLWYAVECLLDAKGVPRKARESQAPQAPRSAPRAEGPTQ